MYILSIFIPLVAFFILSCIQQLNLKFIGFKLLIADKSLISLTAIYLSVIHWLFCSLVLYEVSYSQWTVDLHIIEWFYSNTILFDWGFTFMPLVANMFFIVSTVSCCVIIFSVNYMREDPHYIRFLSYLFLFTFFMLVFVSSSNLIVLFFGWEGIGICSFLLINFWFTRVQANKAALKAIIMNRFGDLSLLLGICFSFLLFETTDIMLINKLALFHINSYIDLSFFSFRVIDILCIFFVIAAMAKSAQIFFHTWLPDAMEGPTPVSALIHAATMVTAGIFLLLKFSDLLLLSNITLGFIMLVGSLTAFMSGTIALVQNDIKKIIAYSTCSQLGFMFYILGIGEFSIAFFHLANHAFFKALLFLSAGSVIHALSNEQDIRRMGGLVFKLPLTYFSMLVGTLAIIGFPFLSGFYSKDLILEIGYLGYGALNFYAYILILLTTFFTSFYSFRLLLNVFYGIYKGYRVSLINLHFEDFYVIISFGVLTLGSIFYGYLTLDYFAGLGITNWGIHFFNDLNFNTKLLDSEFLFFFIKNIPLYLGFAGLILSLSIYYFPIHSELFFIYKYRLNYIFWFNNFFKSIYSFLISKWYIDALYNQYIYYFMTIFYIIFVKLIDKGFLEFFGSNGIVRVFDFFSKFLVFYLSSGYLLIYSQLMLLSLSFAVLSFFTWDLILILK